MNIFLKKIEQYSANFPRTAEPGRVSELGKFTN